MLDTRAFCHSLSWVELGFGQSLPVGNEPWLSIWLAVTLLFSFFWVGELFITYASVKHTCSDRNHKGNVQSI